MTWVAVLLWRQHQTNPDVSDKELYNGEDEDSKVLSGKINISSQRVARINKNQFTNNNNIILIAAKMKHFRDIQEPACRNSVALTAYFK